MFFIQHLLLDEKYPLKTRWSLNPILMKGFEYFCKTKM